LHDVGDCGLLQLCPGIQHSLDSSSVLAPTRYTCGVRKAVSRFRYRAKVTCCDVLRLCCYCGSTRTLMACCYISWYWIN